jgi:hypothetical protein
MLTDDLPRWLIAIFVGVLIVCLVALVRGPTHHRGTQVDKYVVVTGTR